ncbi:DUF6957 family protein [Pseudomonas germanica]|uniref:DUF6957 family protein n=1 Tax=Pseudomonas germanica TaxID=2815720 RepID=UPI002A4E260C|nr:hypothetical protein [Pseudomonas germanica]WPN73645.1 hypothetical protein QMK46_23155 [Pseudomonas germanica]
MSVPSHLDVKTTKHLGQVGGVRVELIGEILFGPAQVLGGSRLEDHELIRLSEETFKGKRFCIVRRWMLLDVLLPSDTEKTIKAQGMEGTILYAQQIVFDSEKRLQSDDYLLSNFQRDFDGCIFESQEVVYILAGRGARKHVSLPALEALGGAPRSPYTPTLASQI